MQQRARALARPAPSDDAGQNHREVVTFVLGESRYAIDTRFVHAVQRDPCFTRLPNVGQHIVGVTQIRGDIVAVLEPTEILGVTRTTPNRPGSLLLLGVDRIELAMLVDMIGAVRSLPEQELYAFAVSAGQSHLHAVTAGSLVIVDAASLLDDPRLVLDQRREAGS
ncbi:MAG: chemotaxis protein CheW [Proteobacteria bacterium]|nr:chemotaxis protein CheW [Pseudomonadota bacterium]